MNIFCDEATGRVYTQTHMLQLFPTDRTPIQMCSETNFTEALFLDAHTATPSPSAFYTTLVPSPARMPPRKQLRTWERFFLPLLRSGN